MINNTAENHVDVADSGSIPLAQDLEQDLLFVGLHSSTGRLRVQFTQGEEFVDFEIQNSELRTKMMSLLLDGIGNALERARKEEGQA